MKSKVKGPMAIFMVVALLMSVANADECEDCLKRCIKTLVQPLCKFKCRKVCHSQLPSPIDIVVQDDD